MEQIPVNDVGDLEKALRDLKADSNDGEPSGGKPSNDDKSRDFDERDFSMALLQCMVSEGEWEYFPQVYQRLVMERPEYHLKKVIGVKPKDYLAGCEEFIHIWEKGSGEIWIKSQSDFEKPNPARIELKKKGKGSAKVSPNDEQKEGFFARWVVRPIADIVGKRLRELIAENSEKKREIDRLNSRVSSLESDNTELEKERDQWKVRWQNDAKRIREAKGEIRDSQIDQIKTEREKEKAEKEKFEQIVKEHGLDRFDGEEDTSPKTVLQAVEMARDELGFLFFFDTAFESAKKSPYQYPDRVLEVLRKMNSVASEWLFQEDGDGLSFERTLRKFHDSDDGPTFEVAEKESRSSQQKHDRVFSNGSGNKTQRRKMLAHVKLGRGRLRGGAGRTLRIHYYAERGKDKVEIGYCGEHL